MKAIDIYPKSICHGRYELYYFYAVSLAQMLGVEKTTGRPYNPKEPFYLYDTLTEEWIGTYSTEVEAIIEAIESAR